MYREIAQHIERGSQRLQERDDGLLGIPFQLFKFLGDVKRLTGVPPDGIAQRERCTVMHQSRTQADSP